MKVCTTCDVEYPDTERFCPRDGTPLRSRDATDDLVGTVVAERYHVVRKLGEGGMGQVYLAEHVRLKRMSAVKVMHPGMATNAEALGRFNREAANACQIQHPNVAAIYDFGETPEGVVYLAMEYIEGDSLAHVIASVGALSLVRAAGIVAQIAEGLEVAHHLGIIHRDLKPDNVLIGAYPDGRDKVKVVDFGISKAPNLERQAVTRTGQVIGTPDYMSPEQLAGDVVDPRSDVYSLAIVAFHMVTGRLPFEADSAQTAMMLRLSRRPSRLAEVRLDVAWPVGLQSVFDRGLALSAEDRYPSATAFASALVASAASLPATATADARTVMVDTPNPATRAAAATPIDFTFPIASGMSPEELSAVKAGLARLVGPIAGVLVKRAAASAPTRQALIAALAAEIDDEKERDQFRLIFR